MCGNGRSRERVFAYPFFPLSLYSWHDTLLGALVMWRLLWFVLRIFFCPWRIYRCWCCQETVGVPIHAAQWEYQRSKQCTSLVEYGWGSPNGREHIWRSIPCRGLGRMHFICTTIISAWSYCGPFRILFFCVVGFGSSSIRMGFTVLGLAADHSRGVS